MKQQPESDIKHRFIENHAEIAESSNRIPMEDYAKYNVKRGLRNADGSGVLVGLTTIGHVHGYIVSEGDVVPVEGKLIYRGVDVEDLVKGFQTEHRPGFEEVCYLLLFGTLPTRAQLEEFTQVLDDSRELPAGFTENMILKAPSNDIMNKLARSVLVLYSYDKNPDDISVKNNLRQCIELIAQFPTMIAYAYQAKAHYHDGKSLFIHNVRKGLSTAENFLHLTRPDSKYTALEAEILDLCLVLHAEHGGGNNSSFTVHVVSSSDTDIYSAIASGVGSLKGPKHGGANNKVMDMMEDIKANVKDWKSKDEIGAYLKKLLNKEAGNRSGLIYGMGHAVYTLSDPRTHLLREKAEDLMKENPEYRDEFELYKIIEVLAPAIITEGKSKKTISANVDFYSGLVYKILRIPPELFTPIFAMSRIAGWAAHRLEEMVSGRRIIRPAYKNLLNDRKFIPRDER